MPVIPQFNADGPAQSRAPVLEGREQAPRLDASGELAQLGNLANRLTRGAEPLQLLPTNFGQASAQGMQALGQGVSDVSNVIFRVQEKAAEARIRWQIGEAQNAMDREAGEFEKWKLQNPDPALWETEWRSRITSFGDNYMAGKDFSPAAKEGIGMRLNSFAERQAVDVGVKAVQAQTALARNALGADIARAIQAKDYGMVSALTKSGVDGWLIAEDEAARIEIQGAEQIRAQSRDDLDNMVKADINRGNYESAIARVRTAPDLSGPEREAWATGLDKQRTHEGITSQVLEEGYTDPQATSQKLQAVDENGNFAHYSGLSAEARHKLGREFRGIVAEGYQASAQALTERMAAEGYAPADLEKDEAFKSLPPAYQAIAAERLKKGALDDFLELSDFRERARDLDTRTEDGKIQAMELQAEASLRFSGGALESAQSAIQNRIDNPRPLTPDETAITMARGAIRERFDNEEFGRVKFTKDEIIEREITVDGKKTGEVAYLVKDANPPKGFGFQERYKTLFGAKLGSDTYRRIILTPDELQEFKATGKGDTKKKFTDRALYDAVGRKFIDSVEEVERKKNAGEYDAAVDYGDELGRLMGVTAKESFQRKEFYGPSEFSAGLDSPSGGGAPDNGLFPSDPSALSDWLDSYNLSF